MAKLKVETNRDTELIKFEVLQNGEIFLVGNEAYVKADCYFNPVNAFRLSDGLATGLNDDDLVTYVKKAELKLTI